MEPHTKDNAMSLALPPIKRRAVGRLTTPSPFLATAGSRNKNNDFKSMMGIASLGVQAADRYVEREARKDLRDANLYVHDTDKTFLSDNLGVEEYDLDKTEDGDLINVASDAGYFQGKVPAYELYADLRKRKYENAVQLASEGMSFDRKRGDFEAGQAANMSSFYAEDTGRATRKQIEYIAKTTMTKVEDYVLKKDFPGARLVITGSDMSLDRQGDALKDLDHREQVDYFTEVIKNRDLPDMRVALKRLIDNDPGSTGTMTTTEKERKAGPLRSAISTAETAVGGAVEAQLKIERDNLSNRIDDVWNNKKADFDAMERGITTLSKRNPVLAKKARWTIDNAGHIKDKLLLTQTEGLAELANFKESMGTGSKEDMELSFVVEKFEEALKAKKYALDNDAPQWGVDAGIIELHDMDYSTMESTEKSFADRLESILVVSNQQEGAFTGFHLGSEMDGFGKFIVEANVQKQLDTFGGINKALGKEYAPAMYEQLKSYGIAGTAAIAGQLMARGSTWNPVARMILVGAEDMKTNPVTQLAMKDADLDRYIRKEFGNMFSGNSRHQALMSEAFKNVWVTTRNKDTAFKLLTKGSINYEGSVIQSPGEGVGKRAYGEHLGDILDEWWEQPSMRAHGYSPKQLQEAVIRGSDGGLKQIGVGDGVQHLMKPDFSIVTMPDGVTPLPFSINMKEPTKSQFHGKQHQDGLQRWRDRQAKLKLESVKKTQKTWDEIKAARLIN